jgi:iron-sulfur cluster assembly protein
MLTVTEAAAREILAAATRSQASGLALRVAAKRHDDGTVSYGMGFDEAREGDEATDQHGLQVLVGAPSRALLDELQLDHVEVEPGRFDFVFAAADAAEVPTPTPTPGCGSGGCSRCGG